MCGKERGRKWADKRKAGFTSIVSTAIFIPGVSVLCKYWHFHLLHYQTKNYFAVLSLHLVLVSRFFVFEAFLVVHLVMCVPSRVVLPPPPVSPSLRSVDEWVIVMVRFRT